MNRKYIWGCAIIVLALFLSFFTYNSVYIPGKPAVNTNDVHITGSNANLTGIIKNGKHISGYGFKWGTNPDLKKAKAAALHHTIKVNTKFSATIRGLQAGTTYYYQAYAANAKGSGYGSIKKFTVPEQYKPITVIITSPADKSSVSCGTSIKICAAATGGHKEKTLELYINNTYKIKSSGSSLTYTWDTNDINPGTYTLKITARDGIKTVDKTITVFLQNDKSVTKVQNTTYSSNSYNSTSVSRAGVAADRYKYPLLSKVNGLFGQFRYRDLSGGRIEVDPVWIAANIVTITLPGLNQQVQVNKAAKDNFIQAFNYIKNGTAVVNGRTVSLLSLIKTMDGTFVTRHVNWNPNNGLSNHSWGTAIDINAADHFTYVDSSQTDDPNYILWEKAFKPAGFSWGNRYGDSMHFELIK